MSSASSSGSERAKPEYCTCHPPYTMNMPTPVARQTRFYRKKEVWKRRGPCVFRDGRFLLGRVEVYQVVISFYSNSRQIAEQHRISSLRMASRTTLESALGESMRRVQEECKVASVRVVNMVVSGWGGRWNQFSLKHLARTFSRETSSIRLVLKIGICMWLGGLLSRSTVASLRAC